MNKKERNVTICVLSVVFLVPFLLGVAVGAMAFPRTETIIKTEYRYIYTQAEETETGFYLSDEERYTVECMVMGEAGGETQLGQMLVAQCILSACEKDGILPSEVRVKYKYSGWNDNPTESVKEAVAQVFDEGHRPVADTPLWFYAPKRSAGRWHETQRFIIEEGGHRFFGEW